MRFIDAILCSGRGAPPAALAPLTVRISKVSFIASFKASCRCDSFIRFVNAFREIDSHSNSGPPGEFLRTVALRLISVAFSSSTSHLHIISIVVYLELASGFLFVF